MDTPVGRNKDQSRFRPENDIKSRRCYKREVKELYLQKLWSCKERKEDYVTFCKVRQIRIILPWLNKGYSL